MTIVLGPKCMSLRLTIVFVISLGPFLVSPLSDAISETSHGVNFISALGKDNIFAVQFHPEKSQLVGERILDRFARS